LLQAATCFVISYLFARDYIDVAAASVETTRQLLLFSHSL